MVRNSRQKSPAGRPRSFDREAALDRAVEMFWANGYDGVDVDRIAEAVGVTKPSIYNAFGDKKALFYKAVQRYAQTYGVKAMAAFNAEADITNAVHAFCAAAVRSFTTEDGQSGCLMACAVATGSSEGSADIRAFFASAAVAGAALLAQRFEKEMALGQLSNTTSALTRGRLLLDLMQGLSLRARAGVPRAKLLADARSYLPLVLG
jgi:AcrR family transcriptional regulator